MKRILSRKLIGAVAGMAAIVGVVLGSAVVGSVPGDVQLYAIALIAGLGGFQIMRQAQIDEQ
jgi:hypothetical protein